MDTSGMPLGARGNAGRAFHSSQRTRDQYEEPEAQADGQEQVQNPSSMREWIWSQVISLMEHREIKETRGSLMTAASIIATVTFAAGIAPPGGVWQEDTRSSIYKHACNITVCVAGNAVLAYYYPDRFIKFTKFNMIAFTSSLVVIFLLMSGFPLSNKLFLWVLSLAMCVTVSFLGLTFLEALWLVIPGKLMNKYSKFKSVSYQVWMAMVIIVGFFLSIRLLYWMKGMWGRLFCRRPRIQRANPAYVEMGPASPCQCT